MAINNKNKGRLRNERTRGPTMNLHSAMTFPCNDDKSPISRRGFKDAIRGVEWRKAPLVGFPTGAMNGVDVLDIDPDGMGWYALKFGAIPETRRHETPRGVHLLFRHAEGLRCSATRIVPDVHVRAEGGYMVWWPRQGYAVDDNPICDWPEWLLEKAMAASKGKGADRSNVVPRSSISRALRDDVGDLVDALRQMDPRDWRGDYDGWFQLAGACKAVGISRDDFAEWCLRDEAYAGTGEENERIWESAHGAHGGALWKALSERGIKQSPSLKDKTPGHHVPAGGNHSASSKPSRRDWRLHIGDILRALERKQTEPMLFWAGCRAAEIIVEAGKPKVEVARGLIEGACPKLIAEIGIAEVRRTIANAFARISHKLKEPQS
jgi:Bifunctional DNA primase/polymerase, N-terminal/Primase C terminal 2 (PriCT-2)